MAEDAHELQFGSKYESWDLAKRAIEDIQIKNVLSIVCPRQQDLSPSQENNTKDSGNLSTL